MRVNSILIQSGKSRHSIKIRNSKLFLNNKLHGFVDSSDTFQLCTTHLDQASDNSSPPGEGHDNVQAHSAEPGGSDKSS